MHNCTIVIHKSFNSLKYFFFPIQTLHHFTDILYFGALVECPKCPGKLIFENSTYVCTQVSSWDKCDYAVKTPRRFIARDLSFPSILRKLPYLNVKLSTMRTRVLHCFRLIDENGTDLVHAYVHHFRF